MLHLKLEFGNSQIKKNILLSMKCCDTVEKKKKQKERLRKYAEHVNETCLEKFLLNL